MRPIEQALGTPLPHAVTPTITWCVLLGGLVGMYGFYWWERTRKR